MMLSLRSLRRRSLLTALAALAAASLAPLTFAQAVGDFNNDGFADLAIGAPGESLNSGLEAGVVHVLYGSGGGLTSVASQAWHLDSVGVPGVASTADHLGRSLAVGDFNGDDFDDLAIGMPGRTVAGEHEAGAALILYGSSTGLVAINAKIWDQDVVGILDSARWNDRFAQSLSSGDYNGDGYSDLAIGIPGEDGEFGLDVGAVAILYGSAVGLVAAGNQFIQQNAPGLNGTAEGNDQFGETLATGDFNNDGRDDLVIGVPDEGFSGGKEAGIVYVVFGTVGGIVTAGAQMWNLDCDGVPAIAAGQDRFGAAMSAGDFNNDGYDDLAIGIPSKRINNKNKAGGVLIMHGSAAGLTSSGAKFWTQNSGNLLGAARTNDRFGYALQAGDYNGDGFDDLAVGIAGERVNGVAEAGAVQILLGSSNGIRGAGNQLWSQDSQGVLDRCETNDRFGATLAAGDFNNDGYIDSAIGVPYENVGATDAGAVAVLYGGNQGLRAGPDQFWTQNSAGVEGQCESGEYFGMANKF